MIFNKIDLKKMFLMVTIFLTGIFVSISVYAADECDVVFPNTQEMESEFSRGRVFSNGIKCCECFKCFKEESYLTQGKQNYKRKIEISKIYKKKDKDKIFKTLVTCNAGIVLTYNKDDFVQIEKYSYNVKHNTSSKKWSLMNIGEVCPQEKNCLLSTKCVLYKEKSSGAHDYVMDGHFDVLCSVNGNIGINTDLH